METILKMHHYLLPVFQIIGMVVFYCVVVAIIFVLCVCLWCVFVCIGDCIKQERVIFFRNLDKGREGYILKSARLLKKQITGVESEAAKSDLYKKSLKHYENRKFGLCFYKQ